MRYLTAILGNSQRLDGGAMFGNAPKALWQRWIAPDEQNRIPLACRAMLVEEGQPRGTAEAASAKRSNSEGGPVRGSAEAGGGFGNLPKKNGRSLLFEAGIGAFFPPKLRDRFGVQESSHVLIDNLAAAGKQPADIDVIVLSHLHFDHAGGLLEPWAENQEHHLAFPDCDYVVSRGAWDRARKPHYRDRASFIPELPDLLEATGRLEIVEGDTSTTLGDAYRLHYSEGHTPGLMLVEVPSDDGPIVFAGDLIPGTPWVHLPITMGYDRYPEALIDEKNALLSDLVSRGGRLFFTHDPTIAMARITKDERARFTAGQTWENPLRVPV